MKRRLVFFASLVLLLSLLGCSTSNGTQKTASETETPTLTSTPLPESTPTPTLTPSSWEIDHYVDDFGDKNGPVYLRGTFYGKFSNSATTGSSLTVLFFYESTYFSIRLFEYDSLKANFSTNENVYFKFKVDNEEYLIDELIILSYGDDLHFTSSDSEFSILKEALLDGKEIKCVVKGEYGETYNFTIDGIGFKETLEEAGMK